MNHCPNFAKIRKVKDFVRSINENKRRVYKMIVWKRYVTFTLRSAIRVADWYIFRAIWKKKKVEIFFCYFYLLKVFILGNVYSFSDWFYEEFKKP
jgi:hypothetical protein